MTEVELSRLLSDLAKSAKVLNEKSESVNALIEHFQDNLRLANVGIAVWPVTLYSEVWTDDDRDGEPFERGRIETRLGFTKHDGEWVLATRRQFYDNTDGALNLVRTEDVTPLKDESRMTRIDALEELPEIVAALKNEAEAAIKAIERAETFVK